MISVDLPSCSGSLNSTFSLTLLFWKLCWGRRATSVKFDVNSYALSLVCLFPFLGITATSCPESFQVPGLRFVFFGDKLQVGIASYGSFPRAQALLNSIAPGPLSRTPRDAVYACVHMCAWLLKCKLVRGLQDILSSEPRCGYPFIYTTLTGLPCVLFIFIFPSLHKLIN